MRPHLLRMLFSSRERAGAAVRSSRRRPEVECLETRALLTSVLVFSRTTGFRHDSIPDGIAAIQSLGAAHGFSVDTTEDPTAFNDANLSRYQAVVFLLTTGDVLNAAQEAAFQRFIQAGNGYVGVHSAADTEYGWSWYGGLVGAYFLSHPAQQTATMRIEDAHHAATSGLPSAWVRFDEWYNYRTNPRDRGVTVLATLDESTYSGGTMGADHPLMWYHAYDGGRAWYTGAGHTRASYSEPLFLQSLLGGIQYATGTYEVGTLEFSAPSYGVSETGPSATVTVTHTGPNSGAVTVRYSTGGGTAAAGLDYTAASGLLTFAPGETSKSFTIPILEDDLSEETETVQLTLRSPTGAALGGLRTATLAIVDNETGPAGRIVDNGDAGFAVSGAPWVPLLLPAFAVDAHFAAAGAGEQTARWSFPGLAPGQYRVSTTWLADALLATNAPFTVKDGGTTLDTVAVNQEIAPAGFSDAGTVWQELGTYTLAGGTLTVELSNMADDIIEADAVRIERVGSPLRVIDSGDADFSATGTWQSLLVPGAFGWDVHAAPAGDGSGKATWSFSALVPGLYRVSATWLTHPLLASNATFTLLEGPSTLGTATVSQQAAPAGFGDAGATWQDLGFVFISGGTLAVELSDLADGFLLADAVRIERVF